MIETTLGLVLRTRPLTETSLIVHWLTPELGRIATVAKGARRPNSPFRGKLDLFYLADFSFSRSRTSDLHNLREISVRDTHSFLRQDITYLQHASYCVGLIEQATESETPLGLVFGLVRTYIEAMADFLPRPQMIFGFELKLLAELGLQPDLSRTQLTNGTKALVQNLQVANWSQVSRLRLTSAQLAELRQFLHGFLIFHLGRVPKGRDSVLETGRRK
jgi:DNA repair protein RecO (recombination protein O)